MAENAKMFVAEKMEKVSDALQDETDKLPPSIAYLHCFPD
jgi:hypothetical protein